MTTKSSHIQIRVTPDQKAILKRLAQQEGLEISGYILSRALPRHRGRFESIIVSLLRGGEPRLALVELNDLLSRLRAQELTDTVLLDPVDLHGLPPWLQNYIAALVERAAMRFGIAPPAWTGRVPVLDDPYFEPGRGERRRQLLRLSPVPFKQRNLFVDEDPGGFAGGQEISPVRPHEAQQRLFELLNAELAADRIEAEIVRIGGAVMGLVYRADTAIPEEQGDFGSTEQIREAAGRVALREGLSPGWLRRAVLACLNLPQGADFFLERSHLRLFAAPVGYLLAAKCAVLLQGKIGPDLDDLRFLMRYLNLENPHEAIEVAARYLDEDDLSARLHPILERLMSNQASGW